MIGIYNYTVILTYMSVASSTIGLVLVLNGHPVWAVFCLALAGLFDMFDGKVARSKKDRTSDEKMFGVQIDSLCDVISFGFYPAIFAYIVGARSYISIAIMIFYALAAVIRLAFFNVLEINRQMTENTATKFYHGLPVTSIAVILPIVYMLHSTLTDHVFNMVLSATLLVTGIAFIVDFKLRKPNNKQLTVLVLLVAAALVFILSRKYGM